MSKIERIIKGYLKCNLDKTDKGSDCLDEQVLTDYFEQKLSKGEHELAENHIANCGFCLSQLNLIFEAQELSKRGMAEKAPSELIRKAKGLLEPKRYTDYSKAMSKKRIKKNLFLIGAIIFFVLSFLIPKYFFQFLVGTLVLGMRWAFESEGARTLIMVLDSWRKHSHDEDDEISNRLKDKFNSFHK